jgi:hypothetical protein|tara:strand:- start:394 stop:585 length:192 start_codon:yes stop_codon:yes gene_type:complete
MPSDKIVIVVSVLITFSLSFVSGIFAGKQIQKKSDKKKSDLQLKETAELEIEKTEDKNGLVGD